MSSFVSSEVDARGVATITLNRPDKANSYDYGMLEALGNHVERFGADAKVRAIVVRGAGKHFSAGADVAAGAEPPEGSGKRGLSETCALIEGVAKPTIALVQGACVGGGMGLACCFDILIADRSAFFSVPEVRLGFTPGTLGLYFARAMGVRAFRRYGMTGQRFSAEEALRIGVVHELCETGELDAALSKQLEEILLAAPNAANGAKRIARWLAAAQVPEGIEPKIDAEFVEARSSAEAAEGKASFKEKRKPSWYPK
jgi:methylglutaconyl-CoA hydratase